MIMKMLDPGTCVVCRKEFNLYDPGVVLFHKDFTGIPEIGEYIAEIGTMAVVLPLDDNGHYLFTIGEKPYQNQYPISLEDYVWVCKTKEELFQHAFHNKVKNGLKIQSVPIQATARKLKASWTLETEVADDLKAFYGISEEDILQSMTQQVIPSAIQGSFTV